MVNPESKSCMRKSAMRFGGRCKCATDEVAKNRWREFGAGARQGALVQWNPDFIDVRMIDFQPLHNYQQALDMSPPRGGFFVSTGLFGFNRSFADVRGSANLRPL